MLLNNRKQFFVINNLLSNWKSVSNTNETCNKNNTEQAMVGWSFLSLPFHTTSSSRAPFLPYTIPSQFLFGTAISLPAVKNSLLPTSHSSSLISSVSRINSVYCIWICSFTKLSSLVSKLCEVRELVSFPTPLGHSTISEIHP